MLKVVIVQERALERSLDSKIDVWELSSFVEHFKYCTKLCCHHQERCSGCGCMNWIWMRVLASVPPLSLKKMWLSKILLELKWNCRGQDLKWTQETTTASWVSISEQSKSMVFENKSYDVVLSSTTPQPRSHHGKLFRIIEGQVWSSQTTSVFVFLFLNLVLIKPFSTKAPQGCWTDLLIVLPLAIHKCFTMQFTSNWSLYRAVMCVLLFAWLCICTLYWLIEFVWWAAISH